MLPDKRKWRAKSRGYVGVVREKYMIMDAAEPWNKYDCADEASSNLHETESWIAPWLLRDSSWMYRRNIIDFCKQKINLDLDVQLLQGKLKFAQVGGRECIALGLTLVTERVHSLWVCSSLLRKDKYSLSLVDFTKTVLLLNYVRCLLSKIYIN